MNQRDERTEMVRSLNRDGRYDRRTVPWGSITYHLGDAGNGGNSAIWTVRGGSSAYPSDTFEASRDKVCESRQEAIQYLRDHFDDPKSVAEAVQALY